MIHHDDARHGFNYRNRTRYDAGIMSASCSQGARCAIILCSLLGLRDGCRRLEPDPNKSAAIRGRPCRKKSTIEPEIDIFPIRDTSLDSPGPIRLSPKLPICASDERIVVPTTRDLRTPKTRPNLKRFCSRDRKHSMSKLGFELVKDGFAEAGRDIANYASYGPTN